MKKKNHGKRVLLVSAKADVGFNIAPPLGLYQLSFFLNERGASCDIFDQELENAEEYIDKAKRGYYGAIGFSLSRISVTPESMRFSLDLIWRFRRAVEKSGFGAFFIAGGQEAALNYKQWLTLGIELIFLGFAEKPMLEFCRRLEKKNDWDGSSSERDSFLEGMHGITFINATGDITYNPSEQFREGEFKEMFYDQIMKIDVPYEKYWDIYRNKASKVNAGGSKFIVENVRLYTASHCPRRCGFCNSQNFLPYSSGQDKVPITILNADQVANLILRFHRRFGAQGVLFSDDDFPVGSREGLKRLWELCERIIHLKGNGDLPSDMQMACQARVADFLKRDHDGQRVPNRELLALMRRAGFGSTSLGVETFNDRVLKAPSINKLGVTVQDARNVLDAMIGEGIVPMINIILGVPEYQPDELSETLVITLEYILKDCDVSVLDYLMTLPGAPIYDTDLYKRHYQPWTHPDTGETVLFDEYFIPEHPMMQNLVNNQVRVVREILQRINEAQGWQNKLQNKRIVNISKLIAAAYLLERSDLVEQFTGVLNEVLGEAHAMPTLLDFGTGITRVT